MLSRDALLTLLSQPVPHEIAAAADAVRQERFALQTTVSLPAQLDPAGDWGSCPVTGLDGGFAASLDDIPDRATDLVLLPAPGSSLEDLAALWGLLPVRPQGEDFMPTAQLGSTDTWIAAIDSASAADAAVLTNFRGLQIVSDGVFPSAHPVRGAQAGERWSRFWRAAAGAGLKGHATVLYGPGHGIESVLDQLEAISVVQRDTGVFLSVAPCVFDGDRMGSDDALLTQASQDLRAWAACRLLDTGVAHVSLRYARSDLKSAHAAVRCGIDDLVGGVFLGDRDRKADSESADLSVAEMDRWLDEVGLVMRVRNGGFDSVSSSEVLA